MRVWVGVVGRASRRLEAAIREYEERAGRYWSLEVVEVREERAGKGRTDAQVRAAESERLLQRLPDGLETIALTRDGTGWTSARLARHLEAMAVGARPGAGFLIGGALGLDQAALDRADRRLSLSGFTLPHELARLVLAEQLYRAGTIVRGEPYHKG